MGSAELHTAIDSYVNESGPSVNYGHYTRLVLKGSTDPDAYAFIFFSRPFPLGSTIVSATLRVYLATTWAGTTTITAKRTTAKWAESKITWNNKPAVSGTNAATAIVTDGVAGQEVSFDLAAMLADVSSGSAWFGVRLEINTTGAKRIWSAEGADAALHPVLEVEWSEGPLAPTDPSPDGGRSISVARPTLSWTFKDNIGDTQQASARVQLDDASDFATPVWDSQKIALTESRLNLFANRIRTKNQSDIETDTTGFEAVGSSTITRDTGTFHQGSASLKTVTTGAGANEGFNVGLVSGSTYKAQVEAGKTYDFSTYLKGNAGGELLRFVVYWYDAADVLLSNSPAVNLSALTTSFARYESGAVAAPASAAYARVRVDTQGTSAYTWFTDALQFEEGDAAGPWRPSIDAIADGATRYWRVMVWDGTDIASSWSDAATFVRTTKGTLTISNPAAPPDAWVEETTPPITWALAGRTQEAVELELRDILVSPPRLLWKLPKFVTSDISYALPEKLLVTRGEQMLGVDEAGFETSTGSWIASGGASILRDTGKSHAGLASLKITLVGNPNQGAHSPLHTGIVPGRVYTVSSWVWGTGANDLRLYFFWYDENDVFISSSLKTITTPPASWTQAVNTAIAPSGITKLRVSVRGDDGASFSYWIDDLFSTETPYRISVRVWDTIDRAVTPGDPDYVELSRDFAYVESGTPAAVGSLVASASVKPDADPTGSATGKYPWTVLQWTRSTQPDYFALVVDGEIVSDRIVPTDVFVFGTTYRMAYYRPTPRQGHTYEVQAVVLDSDKYKHSTGNPTVTVENEPLGNWIVDEDDGTAVLITGQDQPDITVGESSHVFVPIGSRIPVRIVDALRGFEGTYAGLIVANPSSQDGTTAIQYKDNLLELKGRLSGHPRLIIGDLNIPIFIHETKLAPTPLNDQAWTVEIGFGQIGEFSFELEGD